MRHLDDELLAGLALDEPDQLSSADRAHLAVCRQCAGRLAELQRIVTTVRAEQPYPLREPGAGTLAAIQDELGADHAPASPLALAMPDRESRTGSGRRPARRHLPRLVAAAAVLAVAVGGTLWYRTADEPDVVASATLSPLPSKSGTGRAQLIRTAGSQELSIDVTAPVPRDAYEELWLINTDGRRMISLGVVPAGGRARYPVPASEAALKGYTIVDISLEPYDGNAAHSRDSLLRGTLG